MVSVSFLRRIIFPICGVMLITTSAHSEEDFRSLRRYKFVASANEGRKVAILLSHFGPSSQAPFANLVIKEAGKATTEILDSQFIFSGGESELKELEKHVLKTNEQKLKDLGFTMAEDIAKDVPAFWEGASFEAKPLSMYIDTQRDEGYKAVTMTSVPVNNCSGGKKGLDWKICLSAGQCVEATQLEEGMTCYTLSLSQRNIVQVGKIYWNIIQRKVQGLPPTTLSVVDFAGIEF